MSVLAVVVAVLYTPPLAAQPVRSAADSAAMVRALGEETGRGRMPLGRVLRLWTPGTGSDTSVGFSLAVRETLVRTGVPDCAWVAEPIGRGVRGRPYVRRSNHAE